LDKGCFRLRLRLLSFGGIHLAELRLQDVGLALVFVLHSFQFGLQVCVCSLLLINLFFLRLRVAFLVLLFFIRLILFLTHILLVCFLGVFVLILAAITGDILLEVPCNILLVAVAHAHGRVGIIQPVVEGITHVFELVVTFVILRCATVEFLIILISLLGVIDFSFCLDKGCFRLRLRLLSFGGIHLAELRLQDVGLALVFVLHSFQFGLQVCVCSLLLINLFFLRLRVAFLVLLFFIRLILFLTHILLVCFLGVFVLILAVITGDILFEVP